MPQKLKTIAISSIILFSLFLFIKFVSALGSDNCTSNWRLVFHNVHQEKCYALAKPSCKKQELQPVGYPKCLTQPNCIAEAKLIQVKGKECFNQTDLACEAMAIEENPFLNLCPKPACYTVLPANSCQKSELAQSIKFIGQNDPRCQAGKGQPENKDYCSCKAFSDEDLSLKSYLALSGGKPCDLTSAEEPLYIKPEVKTLTPFCQSYKINIQRVCRGAPKINKTYLDGDPSVNYGPPGSQIIIDGLNLADTKQVEVGGKLAEILSVDNNQVKVKIYQDPNGQDSHWCTNNVVLTTKSNQMRVNDLLDKAIADMPIERSAEGYFIIVNKKIAAAELDKDNDSDGQRDETDNCLNTANANQIDNDNDGQGDVCDGDIDGDGILNQNDNCSYVKNANQENQKDPISASGDACEIVFSNLDSDHDLIKDADDNCPYVSNSNQNSSACAGKPSNIRQGDKDNDSDGQRNETDNCLNTANANQIDNDNDGQGDVCDDDIDGDGILNQNDNCSYVKNANQENQKDPISASGDACEIVFSNLDSDHDLIKDADDNCPYVSNSNQNSSACAGKPSNIRQGDKDNDSDGQRNETDNCLNTANANQIDNDNDGQGDVCDDDIDGDGILNQNDNCSYVKNANQENQKDPTSASGDACEIVFSNLDSDHDLIKDADDNCPYVSNQNQDKLACADKLSNTPHYGRISFSPARGAFGSTLTLENDKKILGESANKSWVTFAGDQELPAEFYDTEISYWQSDKIRVKTPRGAKTDIEGKIRVHLCNPTEKRDVYLETDTDFKLIEQAFATPVEIKELKPKIAYFTPNFGVNRRQWQIEKDPYNVEYQEEISLFGRNFDQVSNVSIIDKYGAEFAVSFAIKSPYKIIIQLPAVVLPNKALELYFGQFKVCREQDCDLSKLRFYFQDYSPAAVRSPAIQEIKTLPAKADGFDFIPPYFYKLNQEVEIIGRNFGDSRDDSQVLFWSPNGYLEASGYSKWSNRAIKAIAPNKILSSEEEYQDFSSGAMPILICAAKYGCSSSLNYYPREKFEIGASVDPNQALAELGQPEIIPEIFHLNKSCVAVGETITLRGYNFWDKQVDDQEEIKYYITFPGQNDMRVKAASYSAWSAKSIQTTVPAGAKTGRIAVNRLDKNSAEEKIGFSDEILNISESCAASSGYCFSGNQLPEIYKIEPAQEYVGLNKEGAAIGAQEKVITIYGCNLGKDIGSSYALFNDIKHNQILSWNSYEVKTLMPFDATSGKVSLYVWDGSLGYQTNELSFQVKSAIQKVLPNRGSANQIITILGSDFCQADSCLDLPEVYLSFYQDLGLAGVKANQLLGFNRRQIQFKLDRGTEDDYDLVKANGGKIDAKSAVYSGLLYVKRADGVLSRPYQTETRGHFGYFFERAPNFFTKLPLLKDITPNTVLAGRDTKILLKGENFYGAANLPAELQDYAYGSYPKTKVWNSFLENLNLETKEDYLVKQGEPPGFGPEISFNFVAQDEDGFQTTAFKFTALKLAPIAGLSALRFAGNQTYSFKLKIATANNKPQIIEIKKTEPQNNIVHLGDTVKFSFSVQDPDGNWGASGGPGGWNWAIITYINGSRLAFKGSAAMTDYGLFANGSKDKQTGEASIFIDPQYVKFNQSLKQQEIVATKTLSSFTQKSGIINRHSLLGINYDGSFGLFFKSGAPRLDLRSIASYEADDELIQINTGRSYYGYWSYGRQQLAKVNLQASSIIPFELKIKNPDFLREDPTEKAAIEFTINKEWFQKIYKDDRISITQTLPAINQLGIFDISAVVNQSSGQVNFDFSFYNGIERYYQCNYLDASVGANPGVRPPVDQEKTIVCNSEPYFPGVLPSGQSALAGYGFFQTNQFVVDCSPPKIKNIAVSAGSKIKVSGENLNNVSITINGKGYKSGYSNGSLLVFLSKKLSPGSYVLRAQSKDRCATYPKYDEKKFKIY